jgi:hypothetical protein
MLGDELVEVGSLRPAWRVAPSLGGERMTQHQWTV